MRREVIVTLCPQPLVLRLACAGTGWPPPIQTATALLSLTLGSGLIDQYLSRSRKTEIYVLELHIEIYLWESSERAHL